MGATNHVLDGVLAAAIATGKVLDPAAAFVGVFTAITDRGVATVLADLTEGTGALATRVEVTAWGTPYRLADGSAVVDGPEAVFAPASGAEAQVVLGWFLASAGMAGTLILFDFLPAPVSLPDEHASLTVIPRVLTDALGRWDMAVSFGP